MKLPGYPKVYTMGHRAVSEIFNEPVCVQEKIDGSQFSFGVFEGELCCRSRGAVIDMDYPDKLFAPAVSYLLTVFSDIEAEFTYRGEAVFRPKHNVLAYDRAPKHGVILYDIEAPPMGSSNFVNQSVLCGMAEALDLETVPFFGVMTITGPDNVRQLLQTESCLGGQLVEGVVMKNYNRFGIDGKVLMAKYVSEAFKEKHGKMSYKVPGKHILEEIGSKLCTEARWQKSVIHMREEGLLENSPRDIGKLVVVVKEDILEEEAGAISEALLGWAKRDVLGYAVKGLAEWYKEQLLEKQFESEENDE